MGWRTMGPCGMPPHTLCNIDIVTGCWKACTAVAQSFTQCVGAGASHGANSRERPNVQPTEVSTAMKPSECMAPGMGVMPEANHLTQKASVLQRHKNL